MPLEGLHFVLQITDDIQDDSHDFILNLTEISTRLVVRDACVCESIG
jgi:hypothetical protein